MEPQEAPYASLLQRLSNTSNSNEARLKLLERRLTGELPSPNSLTFDGHHLQNTLDDVTSSRLPQLHEAALPSNDISPDLANSARRVGKKRKVSLDADQQDQARQTPPAARTSPLQQVTNQGGRIGSPAAQRDSYRKLSPGRPLNNRPLQRNTISKYYSSTGDHSVESIPLVSTGTQTHVSLEEQEETMQCQLLAAFSATHEAQ